MLLKGCPTPGTYGRSRLRLGQAPRALHPGVNLIPILSHKQISLSALNPALTPIIVGYSYINVNLSMYRASILIDG